MEVILRIIFQLLAVHNITNLFCQLDFKSIIMGNDILTTTNQSPYIPARRLKLSNSASKLQPETLQKVFGTPSQHKLLKNHTVSYLVPSSYIQEVIQEQHTFEQQDLNERPFAATQAQTSVNTNEGTEAIYHLYQEIERLKRHLNEQKYNSKNYSPVKAQRGGKEIDDVKSSCIRNRKHYFKLKGCEKKDDKSLQDVALLE